MRARRFFVLAVAALSAVAVLAVATSAIGASKNTITIKGGNVYKVNKYAKSTLRFAPTPLVVKSGAKVTVKNPGVEPHSLSIVKKSQLPKTTKQMDACFEAICGQLFAAHEFPESDGPPAKPLVDGGDGFNAPGDSIVIDPDSTISFNVTATKGKTLNYLCGVHPWMQGQLKTN